MTRSREILLRATRASMAVNYLTSFPWAGTRHDIPINIELETTLQGRGKRGILPRLRADTYGAGGGGGVRVDGLADIWHGPRER